jgi:site-specific recombinase XerD
VQPSFDAAQRAFLSYLARRQKAPNTIVKYRQILAVFGLWLGTRSPTDVTAAELEFEYLDWWHERFISTHERLPSLNSQRNQITTIHSFYDFLERRDWLLDAQGRPVRNPATRLDTPRVPQRQNDWLRSSEDERLLCTPMTRDERAIVYLLRWAGPRVSEAAAMLQEHVCLERGSESVRIDKSKTPRGIRTIPALPELVPELEAWLEILAGRGLRGPHLPLLATRKGTHMFPQYIWRTVKRVATRAELRIDETADGTMTSRVTPHTLRRTFGSHLLNSGVRLEVVSYFLGHANTRVTELAYAELLYETAAREALIQLDVARHPGAALRAAELRVRLGR